MMKLSLNLFLTLPIIFVMSACSPKEEPLPNKPDTPSTPTTVAVTGVSLNKTSLSLSIDETFKLDAAVSPSNATDQKITWSSSDASVVAVSNGMIKGLKAGTATITVTAGGKTATCAVTVVKGGFPDGQLPPSNEIWYTTSDNKPLKIVNIQGSSIPQSNNYNNGYGVIHYSGPITLFDVLSQEYSDCLRVTGLLLPDCVETIGDWAFYYGYNIKEFRVPANLNTINGVISSCPTLEKFTGNHVSEDGRCIIFGESLAAFASAGIESYEIPSGVTIIDKNAFAYVQGIKSVVIPSGVKYLEETCFAGSSLESITIPSSVISIHPYTFSFCEKLKNLLGDNTHFVSEDRKIIYDPNSRFPNTIYFFAGKDDTSYDIPEGITCIENYAFYNCLKLKSVTFPESLFQISGFAFQGCDNLESVDGKYATTDHKGYKNAAGKLMFLVPIIDDDYVVPDDVTALGSELFANRHTLKSVTMGDNVTEFEDYVFENCTALKKVVLSANLKSIGYNPFMYDKGLEEVYFRGIIPPSYTDHQLLEASALKFYVPSQSLNLYTTNSGWKDYWGIMKPYEYDDLPTPEYYISTDYSKEGEVTVYQKATEGNGIDVVFMGDAYSDRQVESGLYFNDMKACAEGFFDVEPYKSFRHLFNIYFVTTVSSAEGYELGGQSLGSTPLPGTAIVGNESKCFELALKAVKDPKRMDEVLVVVCVNQDYSEIRMAGACTMHEPEDWAGRDYASGNSVAFFLKLDDSFEKTIEVIQHEAGGHGFAKLADEYNYSGTLSSMDKDRINANSPHGWYSNIDLTPDPTKIKWSWFLADDRYKDEVGVIEGGYTYQYGVWRPTETSIMKNNSAGYYNAPSRYAIWYRIHKLAFGKDWTGTYEDFAKYDAINRKTP
jgi:hypothetical protein